MQAAFRLDQRRRRGGKDCAARASRQCHHARLHRAHADRLYSLITAACHDWRASFQTGRRGICGGYDVGKFWAFVLAGMGNSVNFDRAYKDTIFNRRLLCAADFEPALKANIFG